MSRSARKDDPDDLRKFLWAVRTPVASRSCEAFSGSGLGSKVKHGIHDFLTVSQGLSSRVSRHFHRAMHHPRASDLDIRVAKMQRDVSVWCGKQIRNAASRVHRAGGCRDSDCPASQGTGKLRRSSSGRSRHDPLPTAQFTFYDMSYRSRALYDSVSGVCDDSGAPPSYREATEKDWGQKPLGRSDKQDITARNLGGTYCSINVPSTPASRASSAVFVLPSDPELLGLDDNHAHSPSTTSSSWTSNSSAAPYQPDPHHHPQSYRSEDTRGNRIVSLIPTIDLTITSPNERLLVYGSDGGSPCVVFTSRQPSRGSTGNTRAQGPS